MGLRVDRCELCRFESDADADADADDEWLWLEVRQRLVERSLNACRGYPASTSPISLRSDTESA